MILTGKCKEDFEQWYKDIKNPNGYWYALVNFYGLVDSMKYGVYVDFFDNVNMCVNEVKTSFSNTFVWHVSHTNSPWGGKAKTRQEARAKAIEKANEIYNENN